MVCNIDQKDRTNRIVIGILLLLCALLHWSYAVIALIGIVLIAEGLIGWCGIPGLVEKFKGMLKK